MRRTVPLVLLLAWLLLLPGCEGKGGKTGDTVPAPAPESAAPASPAPTEEPERVSAAGSYGDVAAALKRAWSREDSAAAVPLALGQEAADTMALEGDILYLIQGGAVLICRGGGGEFSVLGWIRVGEDWQERRQENGWQGREKQPVALCALRGRLAVISLVSDYGYTVEEEGRWLFRDNSRCVVELFDTEDPENPVPMATYGQSGVPGCALVRDGRLYVATRRQLFAEEFPEWGDMSALPALFTGEEVRTLKWEEMDILRDGSSWYTLLAVYSPYNGTRLESRALLGGGERMIMDREGLALLGEETGEMAAYSFAEETLDCAVAPLPGGSAGELCAAALRGEDWRTYGGGAAEDDWHAPWDDTRTLSLHRTESGLYVELHEGKEALCHMTAGYDFQAAPEQGRGIYIDAADGLLILPSEDGWAVWRLEEGEFRHVRSLYSPDQSENRRVFLWGGSIYAVDSRRVYALNAAGPTLLGEWVL